MVWKVSKAGKTKMSKLGRQLIRSIKQASNTIYRQNTGKRDWKYEWFELQCAFLDTVVYSWLTPIEVFYENCVRIIRWIPILWKDRNWSDQRILTILRHKIRFTREVVSKYGHYVNSDKYAQQMLVAETLLERLENPEQYTKLDWEEHRLKWPHDSWDNCIENEDGSFTLPSLSEEESKNVKRMMKKAEYMWNQDMEYFCKIFKKHIRKWND